MVLNDRLIEAFRAKYQSDMKSSVSILSDMLKDSPYGHTVPVDHMDRVDKEVLTFMLAKEKATYFEAIIKNLKGEENG